MKAMKRRFGHFSIPLGVADRASIKPRMHGLVNLNLLINNDGKVTTDDRTFIGSPSS